jgi:general stress protein 26
MATFSLSALSKLMRKIDFCMFVTQGNRGGMSSRPMSNNRDVSFKGDCYFFTDGKTQKVRDIKANPQVSLNFEGAKDLFISVSGKAKLITDKQTFMEHWVDDLGRWFKKGIDTPGLTLIHVKGSKLRYWQREKNGEIKLNSK